MDDKKIIAGCKKNEPRYQRLLLNKYAPMLMAVALRYMNREAAAKDVLQDSWIKVFNAIGNYQDHQKLQSWLKTIVINTALSALRTKKTMIISLDPKQTLGISRSNEIESKLYMKDLMKIISDIPSPGREVFMMNIIDGMSHKEIGVQMNISESTSRVHLTNARKYLRKLFSESKELKTWIGNA